MSCRSDNLKTGVARAPHRSLLKALGFVDEELGRPVIGMPIPSMKSFLVMWA